MDRDVHDPEWLVRKRRIDPILDSLGWSRQDAVPAAGAARIEEYETVNGPADYALGVDGTILGVVEAKKLTLGPQNVFTQGTLPHNRALSLRGGDFDFSAYHSGTRPTHRLSHRSGLPRGLGLAALRPSLY